VTQRGVDRRETFSTDQDRHTYLRLLRENLGDAQVSLLAWCLMTNHVHLVTVPAREDSLSILLRRVHGRYAQYYNACRGRSGHLWQNRYFGCMLGPGHLWAALAYVEQNPVRAGLVRQAADYPWSSVRAHLSGKDEQDILDLEWWRREAGMNWGEVLNAEQPESCLALRACTYAGRPFGPEGFLSELGERFGRKWARGRPRKKPVAAPAAPDPSRQFGLF
jgi:putative transposase